MTSTNTFNTKNVNEWNTFINSDTEIHAKVKIAHVHSYDKHNEIPSFHGFYDINLETFVGRKETAKELLDLFTKHKRILITGISGIGKTFFATYCATLWKKKEFVYLFFVNMETDKSAQTCFYKLEEIIFNARQHDETSIKRVYERFNSKKTLVVLDNIEVNGLINKYFPSRELDNIYVLGTSQCNEFKNIFEIFSLDILTPTASVELIKKILSDIKIEKDEEKLLEKLVKELGYHPLAMEQAPAILVDNISYEKKSLRESVENYLKKGLTTKLPDEFLTHYSKPVQMALHININKAIKGDEPEKCEQFLYCLSYLNPTRIDTEMFKKHEYFKESILLVLRQLKKFSIIHNYSNTQTQIYHISLHRLIQKATQALIEEDREYITIRLLMETLFLDFSFLHTQDNHYEYIVKYTKVNKDKLSALYIESFYMSENIWKDLNSGLQRIGCDKKDVRTWSVLNYCAYAGHTVMFDHFDEKDTDLINGKDVMTRFRNEKWTVFHADMLRWYYNRSTLFGERSLLNFLRSNQDLINQEGIKNFTFLNIAVAHDVQENDITELLEMGCDVNIPDAKKNQPIDWAIINMNYGTGYKLIQAGAALSEKEHVLFCAAAGGDLALTIKIIKEEKVNVNIKDNVNNTPLLIAVKNGHFNVVRELIIRGADINVINNANQTPLSIANEKKFLTIKQELNIRLYEYKNIRLSKNMSIYEII